jgi:hypothetical protein
MKSTSGTYSNLIGLAALVLLMQACITDEFRVKDISIDEDWEIGIVTPIFSGKLEFRDFIHDWKKDIPDLPGSKVVLYYADGTDVTIPVELLFDQSAVIDSLPFYIQWKYTFSDVALVFTVENGSPFPLNLEMFFYEGKYNESVPAIAPLPFWEADFSQLPVIPVITTDTVSLSDALLAYFVKGNRVRLDSWFLKNNFILTHDTLNAHYPVNVSIVLIGKVKVKQND